MIILVPPCPSIRLANLLTNEEIARARIGHVVSGTPGIYLDFIQTQLHGCLVGIPVTSVSLFPSEVRLYFILYAPFPYFHFVIMFVCCTLRLHLLKKRKREKRTPILAMLVAFLVLSWRLILTFLLGNMQWWILMGRTPPWLQTGQNILQMSLGLIRCILESLVPCSHFFLAHWIAHDLVDLCFRLMLILWKKACRWSEVCNW